MSHMTNNYSNTHMRMCTQKLHFHTHTHTHTHTYIYWCCSVLAMLNVLEKVVVGAVLDEVGERKTKKNFFYIKGGGGLFEMSL